MSEKEIFNEGKKRLAKKFYYQNFYCLAITLVFFIVPTILLIVQWSWQDRGGKIFFFVIAIISFFLSFFLVVIIFKGSARLKRNEIKTITGTVVEFKQCGDADGNRWYHPVVKTPSGKKITVEVNAVEDDIKSGHKYRFLNMLGISVLLDELPIEEPKEKTTFF